jgi:hypothetical protein
MLQFAESLLTGCGLPLPGAHDAGVLGHGHGELGDLERRERHTMLGQFAVIRLWGSVRLSLPIRKAPAGTAQSGGAM